MGGRVTDQELIPVEVRVVAEEEQAFQSFGFEQDLLRHPLAFASQILDQPVHGLDKHSSVASRPCEWLVRTRQSCNSALVDVAQHLARMALNSMLKGRGKDEVGSLPESQPSSKKAAS
jgi:hypothetical protein